MRIRRVAGSSIAPARGRARRVAAIAPARASRRPAIVPNLSPLSSASRRAKETPLSASSSSARFADVIPVLASFSQVFSARSAVAKRNLTVRPPPERSRDAARLNARGSPSPPARDRGAGCFLSALRRQLSLGDFFFAYFLSLPSLRPPADVDPLTFSPPRSDLQRRDRPQGPRDVRGILRRGQDLGGPGRGPVHERGPRDSKDRPRRERPRRRQGGVRRPRVAVPVRALRGGAAAQREQHPGVLRSLRLPPRGAQEREEPRADEEGCRERQRLHRLADLHRRARGKDRRRRRAAPRAARRVHHLPVHARGDEAEQARDVLHGAARAVQVCDRVVHEEEERVWRVRRGHAQARAHAAEDPQVPPVRQGAGREELHELAPVLARRFHR
eukprot:18522-Pelagococcus_subviridis.AAC.17